MLKVMLDNGIPTVVWLSPILPFINDTEENIRGILKYCVEAKVHGIICFGMGVTMRDGNREYFYKKLDEYFPGMKDRYIKTYGYSYELTSDNNKKLMKIVREVCASNDILFGVDQCFEYIHKFEDKKGYEQLVLPRL